MSKVDFSLDLGPMVERAVQAEISRFIADTSGYGTSWGRNTPNAKIRDMVEQAMTNARTHLQQAVTDGIIQAAVSKEVRVGIAKATMEPLAKAIVGGMGNTCANIGRELGRDEKFKQALLGTVTKQLMSDPQEDALLSARGALGQASFALRELLPNHPDAQLTVEIIKDAQAKVEKALGK